MRFRWALLVIMTAFLVGVGIAFYPSTSPTAKPVLTWAQLRNTTYPLEVTRSKQAPLHDGAYEEEIVPGAASKITVRLADIVAFGELDDDSSLDAAVILVASTGGSGTFIYLAAVGNRGGDPFPISTGLLGDRVAVRSIRIEDRKVIIGMRIRGATDPLTALTTEVTRVYTLQNNQLQLEDEQTAIQPAVPPGEFSFEPSRLTVTAGKAVTRSGTLKPGELATLLLPAGEGQEVRITLRSEFNNAILSVQGAQDLMQLVSRSSYLSSWSGPAPTSQDYVITVVSLAGYDLEYELTIELGRSPTARPSTTPKAAATPTPIKSSSLPAPLHGTFQPAQMPLAAISTGGAEFLNTRLPSWGAAVALPQDSMLYSQNGDLQLQLASVVKVLIAIAVLDAAEEEGRYVDRFELSLLWPMITLSDNDSASQLWNLIGSGRGLNRYLTGIGATGVKPYDGEFWGTTTASANGLATLLSRVVFGDLLNPEHRALIQNLLESVTAGQRWGISAGAATDDASDGIVGLKDGWYPADEGWRVNSLGFVVGPGAGRYYVIVVLSNGQPTWEYGIRTIEGAAEQINLSLLTSHP